MINQTEKIEEKKKMRRKALFPIVLKNTKLKMVNIIYNDRIEMYGSNGLANGFKIETKKELDDNNPDADPWTPWHEVEIALDSGFRRVHDTENGAWD